MKEAQDSGVILFNLYYLEQSCTPSVMRSSLLYKVAHPLFGQLSLLEFFFFFFGLCSSELLRYVYFGYTPGVHFKKYFLKLKWPSGLVQRIFKLWRLVCQK